MKTQIAALMTFFIAAPALAVTVKSARMDASGQNLLVNVTYGGGCVDQHDLRLEMGGCLESMPVQCSARIVDKTTDDHCEAIVSQTAKFNLKKLGLTDSYFSGASVTFTSKDVDSNGRLVDSKVTVRLPEQDGSSSSDNDGDNAVESQVVTCNTHTGSLLLISQGARAITIKTVDGQVAKQEIVRTEMVSLESLPPIDRRTHTLDDGRKIVVSFRGNDVTGTGLFIRLGGDRSPTFTCTKQGGRE